MDMRSSELVLATLCNLVLQATIFGGPHLAHPHVDPGVPQIPSISGLFLPPATSQPTSRFLFREKGGLLRRRLYQDFARVRYS